ncbi:MAG TPA: hypothetical protein VF831_12030 [Anaerolineales bacterium]
MVSPEDVISLYQLLTSQGIKVWILGGWGVDALLGMQTRLHKDLDLLMLLDDVAWMCALLTAAGYELKEIWSENRWALDARRLQTLTAFVLTDAARRELDFHAMRLDEQGNGIPAWEVEEGFIYTGHDLSGNGSIAGVEVRCITAEKQMLCHTGYDLPEKQLPDLQKLHDRFGVMYPESHSLLRSEKG